MGLYMCNSACLLIWMYVLPQKPGKVIKYL